MANGSAHESGPGFGSENITFKDTIPRKHSFAYSALRVETGRLHFDILGWVVTHTRTVIRFSIRISCGR
jgi:hypothetical protein